MLIYPDTMLWNGLYDCGARPEALARSLASRGAQLVLSHQTIYELMKTFRKNPPRAAKLLSFVAEFLEMGTPCTPEVSGILEGEMRALQEGTDKVRAFLRPSDCEILRRDVGALARGEFDGRASEFVNERSRLAALSRFGPKQALAIRPIISQRLASVPIEDLDVWLDGEMRTPWGITLLMDKILKTFPEAPVKEAWEWACGLVFAGGCRIARALVRADLYYNWRFMNRGSLRGDLYHDMYHILNGVYCDVYATKEARQAEYAHLLLTPMTRVAIYDGQGSLADWLLAAA